MANPNIVNVSTINALTVGHHATTADTTVLSCTSNIVIKVNSITVSNVDGTNNADVTITWYDSSAGQNYKIAHQITVPAKSTLVVLSKDSSIYLNESDQIKALASVNSDLDVIISYEQIS